MSTRIKVFNYVMSADINEATRTLDEARALLATRRAAAKPVAPAAKPKAKAKPKTPPAAKAQPQPTTADVAQSL